VRSVMRNRRSWRWRSMRHSRILPAKWSQAMRGFRSMPRRSTTSWGYCLSRAATRMGEVDGVDLRPLLHPCLCSRQPRAVVALQQLKQHHTVIAWFSLVRPGRRPVRWTICSMSWSAYR
jgi:hypothetical protein